MKKRSIAGFITGIVGVVLGVPIGFYAYIILSLILGLGGFENLVYSVYLFIPAGIIAIIGVSLYFTQARIGGALMFIATVLYISPFVCGVCATIQAGENFAELILPLIIGNIPTILLLTSTILGLSARTKVYIIPENANQINETK